MWKFGDRTRLFKLTKAMAKLCLILGKDQQIMEAKFISTEKKNWQNKQNDDRVIPRRIDCLVSLLGNLKVDGEQDRILVTRIKLRHSILWQHAIID